MCEANLGRRGEQRPQESEMLDVGGDDLVRGGQVEPGEDDIASVRGRADEGNVLGRELEQAGERLAGALAQGEDLLEVGLSAAALLEIALVPFRHRFDCRARERAVRAGVQVRVALEDRELGSSLLEGHVTLASTGAWSEKMRPSTRRRSTG